MFRNRGSLPNVGRGGGGKGGHGKQEDLEHHIIIIIGTEDL